MPEAKATTQNQSRSMEDKTLFPVSQRASWRAYVTVLLLFLLNMLNFMDRFSISAVLVDILEYFKIQNSNAGFLHTSFILFYTITSPLCGYLGDRYSRKLLITLGVLFWAGVTFAGSFVPNNAYWLFLLLRALGGVGEASYSAIGLTLIADLFVKSKRSSMLALFYFAIPIGCGLGYVVGAETAKIFNDWRWAFRITPGIGAVASILLLIVLQEPRRGAIEGAGQLEPGKWCEDLKHLWRNKSYIAGVIGFTAINFIGAGLTFWMPKFLMQASAANNIPADSTHDTVVFGILTCFGGIGGISLGSQTVKFFRHYAGNADPLICAWSLIICTPFIYLYLTFVWFNRALTWTLIALIQITFCIGMPLSVEITLQVIIPTRRATAQAFEILISHLLGGATGPSVIGLISDAVVLLNAKHNIVVSDYQSLQFALYTASFISILGAAAFFACALFIERDKCTARIQNIHSLTVDAQNNY